MMALSLVAMAAAYSPTLPHIVASRAPARAARFAPLTLDGVIFLGSTVAILGKGVCDD